MSGLFGVVGKENCKKILFYGVAARRAIRAIEGKDIEDVTEYIDSNTEKFRQMVEWIKNDLGVTSLRYQTVDDMIKAIGLPRESLCLYCWCGK